MSATILQHKPADDKLADLEAWRECANEFLEMRAGLFEATPDECLVGFVNGFTPVYVAPWEKEAGETWYAWLIVPGEGKFARLVNEVVPGTYLDAQNGDVYEHDPAWVLVLGTVTRKGVLPLLTPEMVREYRERQTAAIAGWHSEGTKPGLERGTLS